GPRTSASVAVTGDGAEVITASASSGSPVVATPVPVGSVERSTEAPSGTNEEALPGVAATVTAWVVETVSCFGSEEPLSLGPSSNETVKVATAVPSVEGAVITTSILATEPLARLPRLQTGPPGLPSTHVPTSESAETRLEPAGSEARKVVWVTLFRERLVTTRA